MGRGRKRIFNAGIPAHIDQAALPKGIYWSDNRWFIYEQHPEGGRPRKRTVADGNARLSELHAIIEERNGGDPRGSLVYVCGLFQQSLEFQALADATQRDYRYCAELVRNFELRDGSTFGGLQVAKLAVPSIQRLIERIAGGTPARGGKEAIPGRPSSANHVLRYLRRMFAWAIRHGHLKHNPARGVKQVEERELFRMPTPEAFAAVLAFARERGQLKAHTEGSAAPYLPHVMVLAYKMRLRGIEVITLTDANRTDLGVVTNRRKGSRDNVTLWDDEMRAAWDALVAYRADRLNATRRATLMRPEQRYIVVSQSGTPLRRSSLDSAWQRLMAAAITAGVIAAEDYFTLHGLKHRGVTDTGGNIGDKQEAGGHVDQRMTARYNHDLPVVKPAGKP